MYRTLGILVLLFLGVTTLKADPVVITGGTLLINQAGSHPFTLTGDGTVINGLNGTLNDILGGTFLVNGGQQIQGLRLALDSQDAELISTFPITVGGVTYSSGNAIVLQLQSNPIAFIVPGPANGFVVTAPLSLTGGVFGFNSPFFQDPLFSHTLSGQGTQVLTFSRCFVCNPDGTVYQLNSWVLTVGAVAPGVTVQAVPEPSSVLLLMTSVGALSWVRRRNRWKG